MNFQVERGLHFVYTRKDLLYFVVVTKDETISPFLCVEMLHDIQKVFFLEEGPNFTSYVKITAESSAKRLFERILL